MRLPAFSRRHRNLEDARVGHEAVWCAYLEGQRIRIPTALSAARISNRGRQFWNPRGFRFHTHKIATGFEVWISELPTSFRLQKCLRAKPEAA